MNGLKALFITTGDWQEGTYHKLHRPVSSEGAKYTLKDFSPHSSLNTGLSATNEFDLRGLCTHGRSSRQIRQQPGTTVLFSWTKNVNLQYPSSLVKLSSPARTGEGQAETWYLLFSSVKEATSDFHAFDVKLSLTDCKYFYVQLFFFYKPNWEIKFVTSR